jgi:LysM repeat protein
MNEANPFQTPAWLKINREQRRRERVKKTVTLAVAASVLLLVALLIHGSKTELAARALKPATSSQSIPVVATQAAIPTSQQAAAALSSQPSTIYVVKTGDTLTGIAKAHGTTIKAIETANGLTNDRISIGEKLKIPKAAASSL